MFCAAGVVRCASRRRTVTLAVFAARSARIAAGLPSAIGCAARVPDSADRASDGSGSTVALAMQPGTDAAIARIAAREVMFMRGPLRNAVSYTHLRAHETPEQ